MASSTTLKKIKRSTLKNKRGMQVEICDFGARILSIKVKNARGELVETTLNHHTDEDILSDSAYMGATCGRVSNRISNATFFDGNQTHHLDANDGKNTLHGGREGFSNQFWMCSACTTTQSYQELTLTLASPDGDQGFPGNLTATVTYRLDNKNRLSIFYAAKSDSRTPINMCNHAYFTLGESDIKNLRLHVNADHYLPLQPDNTPTGEISKISPQMTFSHSQKLAEKLLIRDFDDCYVLNKNADKNDNRAACVLVSDKNQLQLEIFSNHASMQVYTGNYLPQKHSAIALEAQGLVDAVNQAGFESDWLGPSCTYTKEVHYQYKLK